MTEKIEADYESLERLSQLFVQHGDLVAETITTVKGCVENLRNGGWIGRGADSFFNEMTGEVLPATERLRAALEESGNVSKQMSAILLQAEEEASTHFKSNTF